MAHVSHPILLQTATAKNRASFPSRFQREGFLPGGAGLDISHSAPSCLLLWLVPGQVLSYRAIFVRIEALWGAACREYWVPVVLAWVYEW